MKRAGRRRERGRLSPAFCTRFGAAISSRFWEGGGGHLHRFCHRFGAAISSRFWEGGGGHLHRFCHRTEVPRPAPRGEGEVKNPARRSPGGRRKEILSIYSYLCIHFETFALIGIFGFPRFAVTSISRRCGQKPYTFD